MPRFGSVADAPMLLEATGLALLAALSPTALLVTAVYLGSDRPKLIATLYLAGAITGALVFGHLTDRLGRKKLFTVTLLIYLTSALLTAFLTASLLVGYKSVPELTDPDEPLDQES